MRKTYSFTFYFLYFAALACLAPFVVLFYQQLGFSGVANRLIGRHGAAYHPRRPRRCGRGPPMRPSATGSS